MADSNTNSQEDEQIQFILRQTDYTSDEARTKLTEHKNDYMAVIRSYLKQGLALSTAPAIKPLSMNQQIYKEIRSFMDEADLSK
jgi:hypothetical protein